MNGHMLIVALWVAVAVVGIYTMFVLFGIFAIPILFILVCMVVSSIAGWIWQGKRMEREEDEDE